MHIKRRQKKGERRPVRIKIKKDDLVRVIAGRDKGKTGKVLEVDRLARKLTVEGVMVVKRHTRPNPSKQIKGGIADKPMPMDVSNVMILTCRRCANSYCLQDGNRWRKSTASSHRAQKWRNTRKKVEVR